VKLATIQGALEIGLDYQRYIPAAKVDQVASPQLDYAAPHNIGDWFVTKVTDRLLAYDELLVVAPTADQYDWDVINSECGAMVLKGGNYIQPDWLSRNFGIDLFRKIKIPIILFGVGVQAGWSEQVDFQPEEIEILRYIHDSCANSSVRGYSTAEQLAKIGITNTVVTACPTIFWSRRPEIIVRPPSDERVGFSFRQSLYSDDPALLEAEFRAIETVRDRAGVLTVILQGEEVLLQFYLEVRRWGAEFEVQVEPVAESGLIHLQRRTLDLEVLRSEIHEQFARYTRPAFLDWVMNNSFFSYDVGEYVATYRDQGLVIGCRLHSNLVSLANGTPTMFLTYDERTKELAELLEIPNCPVTDFGPHVDPFEQDWRPFEKSYAVHFAEMCRFLDSNGLPHRMES
jgi:hypothetical protein